jgi:hypothetical protein
MSDFWPVKKGVISMFGAINKMVSNHKVSRFDMGLERASGTGSNYPFHPQPFKGPDICFVWYLVGREMMIFTMSG